jgi:hypothetical protein
MFINENGIDKEIEGTELEAVLQAQSEISAEFQKTENDKELAKQARIAVLTKLGLTEDDFKALGL